MPIQLVPSLSISFSGKLEPGAEGAQHKLGQLGDGLAFPPPLGLPTDLTIMPMMDPFGAAAAGLGLGLGLGLVQQPSLPLGLLPQASLLLDQDPLLQALVQHQQQQSQQPQQQAELAGLGPYFSGGPGWVGRLVHYAPTLQACHEIGWEAGAAWAQLGIAGALSRHRARAARSGRFRIPLLRPRLAAILHASPNRHAAGMLSGSIFGAPPLPGTTLDNPLPSIVVHAPGKGQPLSPMIQVGPPLSYFPSARSRPLGAFALGI